MKKITAAVLSLILMLSFTACGTKAEAGWQEQYDLGIKYVNEAKYEEAVLAFTKALEIDPMQTSVYISLAESYMRQGDYSSALSTVDKAIEVTGRSQQLTELKNQIANLLNPGPARTERETYPDGSFRIYEYRADDTLMRTLDYATEDYMYSLTEFDSNGKTTRKEWYTESGGTEFIYEYDDRGNLVRQTYFDSDGNITYIRADDYNEENNCIRSTWYNADGTVDRTEEYS